LQRFLSLPQLNIKQLWFPIIQGWIEQEFEQGEVIHLVIDRSQWQNINLLMVSLVYARRAIPLYFFLLPKKGNSNLSEQKQILEPVLSLLNQYRIIVLGDREFCGVELAKWLSSEQQTYLVLRLKKNEYVELEEEIWFQLKELGLAPGVSVYYRGIKVTKTKGFGGFNLAAKWRKNYRGRRSKEPWFLMTNLETLTATTDAYAKRMGIEEMFRDLKLGGYNLEKTQVNNERLIALILLITFAYCQATFSGKTIKSKGVAKYVTRPTEPRRTYRRASTFSTGLHGRNWVDSLNSFPEEVEKLISFCPHKRVNYQQGLRAASLILSAL